MSPREARKAVELLESDEAVAGSDRGQELIGVLGSQADTAAATPAPVGDPAEPVTA